VFQKSGKISKKNKKNESSKNSKHNYPSINKSFFVSAGFELILIRS